MTNLGEFGTQSQHMLIHQLHVVVTSQLCMHTELLNTVCVPIATVAAQLNGMIVVIGTGSSGSHMGQFMGRPTATFTNVIHQAQTLQVLIGFAVQLEVRFEVGFVAV